MLARFGDRNSVRPSVCPSVRHTRELVYILLYYHCSNPAFGCQILINFLSCLDETVEHTDDILIPYERVIILVFWHQLRLVDDVPVHLKFALKLTHPPEKDRLRPMSAYNVWTVKVSVKCSLIANIKSTTRFSTSYRWSTYVTPNSPKGWLKKWICRFCEKNSSLIE